MLERLARTVLKHRLLVVAAWVGLIVFGLYATTQVSNRWLEQFSIPGYSAYEANQHVPATPRRPSRSGSHGPGSSSRARRSF
jgi:RND superfamily putative drug exporter